MNTEDDLYCTCDIGPFAECHVCNTRPIYPKNQVLPDKNRHKLISAQLRIAEIKAGYLR